jgi:tetratricopeptide (TPR) repeat protein
MSPPSRGLAMNRCAKWFVYLFSCVVATLSFSPQVTAGDSQWMEIQSPHFSVVTDAGEHRGREVAMRFEQMRGVFGTLMVKANVNLPVPLQIVAFRNTKELRQFAPLWNGKPTQVSGLFQGGDDRSFIMLDMGVENPWTVVFHEYAHQLMNGNLAVQMDPWFEEGFAEYFSSIEVDGKEARVGKVPEFEYQVMQHENSIRIADLFKIQQNSQTYNESGDHRTVFYAESGMLVHYLYDNQLLPKLSTYFNLKDKKVSVEDAIQQAFGMSAPQFDKVLRDYVSSGRYRYYPVPTPANIDSKTYTVKPLSVPDSSAILADIHLHSRDYLDQSMTEFQSVLKADPNNAAACRGLGYAYMQKRDFDQAGEYFRRSSQADSKDPRVHYYSALLMSREGSFADRSELPVMTNELETSIALDPNFGDAYALLAFAQAYGPDPAKSLETMRKAVLINPRNENYQYNLAQMYLTNQKFDAAIALLENLQKTQDPALAQRVAVSLSQAQDVKASRRAVVTSPNSPLGAQSILVRRSGNSTPEVESVAGGETFTTLPSGGPAKFLKGTVTSVDCSAPPSAVLTVASGTHTWKMKVTDSTHVILIGADQFSCAWNRQKVAVNYRETGADSGSIISLEIQ